MKKNRVVITVSGGLITGISADNPKELNVLIVDFDCDNQDNCINVPIFSGEKGETEPAILWEEPVSQHVEFIDHYFNLLDC